MSSSATSSPVVRRTVGLGREDIARACERCDQHVDLLGRVVDVERSPNGRGRPVATHHELRAVMPRPNGDPLFVQDRRQIVRVDVVVPEADRPSADIGVLRTVDHRPGLEQTIDGVPRDLDLVGGAVVYGPKDTDVRGGTVSFWY